MRAVLIGSAAASAVLLIAAAATGSFGAVRAQVLLTFVGLAVGALLGWAQLRAAGRGSRLLWVGLAGILISQGSFLLLVWTGWRTRSPLWRIWWVSMVPSVCVTHLLLLRAARGGRPSAVGRLTAACAAVAAAMILALGLRRDLLSDVHRLYLWIGLVPVAGATIGSAIAAVGWLRGRVRPRPMGRIAKIALLVCSHAALLAAGWYVGRRSALSGDALAAIPSAMARLPAEEVRRHTLADLNRLKTVAPGLAALQRDMAGLEDRLAAALAAEGRDHSLPAEDDQRRWHFVTFLSYRAALLRLVATYSGFQAVRDAAGRARCFLLGHAAAMTAYEADLRLVRAYRDRPRQRRKLNEPEPAWGLPAGMFDRICQRIASQRAAVPFEQTHAYFELKRPEWRRAGVWPKGEIDWLEGRIAGARRYVGQNRIEPLRMRFDIFLERVRKDARAPVYAVQSLVAEWIGDTRIVQRAPFVGTDLIGQVAERLRPGDILLERRNWFLSNAFLPGFWPHAALYVGRPADLRRLGIADDPAVREHLAEFARPAPDGRPNAVIEAVSEGVIFNSLAHSLHADYVAVLRPRLSDKQIAGAIARAFRHKGKPYDFEFDFATSDKLVCTELVYRCYEGLIHFDLKRVMGRDTLPAVEIVRKFAGQRAAPGRELDFVLFLDADPQAGTARFAGEDEFCASADRPRSFNE